MTEQICFRYDGSEEAKKCIEWMNKTYKKQLCGGQEYYHSPPINGVTGATFAHPTHRLVTPAEFLRLVSEPEWKVGDECYLASNSHYKWEIVSFHKDNLVKIKREDYEVYYLTHLLRPIRKSLRDEINDIAKQWLLTEDHYDFAECVIEVIKQRKDEL